MQKDKKNLANLLIKADKLSKSKEIALAEEFIDIEEKIQGSRDSIEEKLDSTIKGLEDLKEIKNVIENKETDVIRTELLHIITLKGDKGDDGKDYTLTNTDKKEIASMVKVPVVEKVTEIIKEPIYTENIIEKALYENAEDIVSKINELPIDEDKQIDASHIKNLPEIIQNGTRIGFGSMLKDAPKDGLIYARQNRQWVEVVLSGGGGGAWGSITGTLSDQTDLQNALNAKQDSIITGTSAQYLKGDLSLGTFPTNVSTFTNDSGYITSSALTGYVPTTRTLTINGTTLDLSADRSWTISSGTASTGLTNTSGTWTVNLSTGKAGGQSVIGGTASDENLTLSSTSNATKGKILFGTSAYDEVNNRLGIGTTNPGGILDIYKFDNSNPVLMRIWNGGSGGAKLRFVADSGGTAQHQWTTDKYLAAIAANNTIGMQFRVGLNATEAALDASTRMTITTDGKVGIGTTTPANNLDVNGTAAVGISQDIVGGGTKAGGALLVGSSTLVSSIGYGTLQDNVIQLGDNISTNYYAHSPTMAFSTNQTGVGQLVGRLIGVNSSLGTLEKRVAQISLHTDTATNNGKITLDVTNGTTLVSGITVKNSGNVGIQVDTPTAYLHIKAGTATANTAPLKLTSGTNLTTPENGAFEFDGTNLYFTVGGVRKTVSLV